MRFSWIMLCVACVVLTGSWQLVAEDKPKADDAQIKRGEYLVNTIAHCGDCHTPHNDKGEPSMPRHLQGAKLSFAPKVMQKEWKDTAPDITVSGKAGKWSEEAMVTFLTTGKDSKGEKPKPPMPSYTMTLEDAKAMTAYLRSLPGAKKDSDK
jgi:mono/diheme cytochrome c family protein